MKLNLKRPIVFLDLETTGVDPAKDRIVEISLVKVMPDGSQEVKTRRLNPEMHIPEAASAVHGIHDEDVANCPTFREISKSLWSYISGCDFAGYNSNKFDIPVLVEEFCGQGSMWIWINAVSSMCRISSTAWSSGPWLPPTSSIAGRI